MPQSRFTEADRKKIVELDRLGLHSPAIGKRFGVSGRQISRILQEEAEKKNG